MNYMIDEKKLEKEAYKETNSYNEQERAAFIAGVNWAIQEFIKCLWHEVNEAPKDYTDIIYVDEDNDVWNEDKYYADKYDDTFCKGWQSFVSSRNVIKWCYTDDIL